MKLKTGNPTGSGIAVSLPVRERGLKLGGGEELEKFASVAPRAGAWIETKMFPPK